MVQFNRLNRKDVEYYMVIYVSAHLIVLMMGLFYEAINSMNALKNQNKKIPSYFFTVPSFVLLFIISAFRGDFNVDYKNYSYLFKFFNQFDFSQALQATSTEVGYKFLSRSIGVFTDNELYLFITVSFIILACFYSQFNKYSAYIWLSVLMFVAVGPYYSSFNIMRQVLAAAIIFSGSKFLYERKPFKYFLVVLLASSFHSTSIIMVIFYYILNLKFSLKNIAFILFSSVFLMFSLDKIISFVQTHYYTSYTESAYGMTGASFTSAVLPISILLFTLFNYRKIDLNSSMQRIWLNAVIFYAFFSILGLQVFMVERLKHFFSPYALLLIPLIFSRIKPKDLRVLSMIGLILLLISYHYVVFSGTDYDPYYFIWDSL